MNTDMVRRFHLYQRQFAGSVYIRDASQVYFIAGFTYAQVLHGFTYAQVNILQV